MIAAAPSESIAELEARLSSLTAQRTQLHARVAVLDAGIAEVTELAGEIEERLKAQESEVARLMLASGQPITFGRDYTQRTVTWTDGNGTQQLSGPRPMDTARGQADHARRVLDAMLDEAQPIRASLASLENERQEAKRAIAAIGGEIGPLEVEVARIRQEEGERAALIGERLDWRDRLAGILRRLAVVGG